MGRCFGHVFFFFFCRGRLRFESESTACSQRQRSLIVSLPVPARRPSDRDRFLVACPLAATAIGDRSLVVCRLATPAIADRSLVSGMSSSGAGSSSTASVGDKRRRICQDLVGIKATKSFAEARGGGGSATNEMSLNRCSFCACKLSPWVGVRASTKCFETRA